ncbi:MAG: glycerophosphodiester phosphodiesterase [Nocardioides sp.]
MGFNLRAAMCAGMGAALVLPLLTIWLGTSPAAAAGLDNWTVVAHRGYPGRSHTENTMPALNAALRAGAPAIETDLQLTADLEPMVMHDYTLNRTTTCSGDVSAWLLDDVLRSCRGQVNGEELPTLRKVLTWAKERQVNVILDVKGGVDRGWTVERFLELEQLLIETGMSNRAMVMSFLPKVLQQAKAANPDRRTDWIVDGPWPGVAVCAANADVVNVKEYDLTTSRVRALHQAGVQVFGRNLNHRAGWKHLRRVGADGLLTDRAATFVRWQRR